MKAMAMIQRAALVAAMAMFCVSANAQRGGRGGRSGGGHSMEMRGGRGSHMGGAPMGGGHNMRPNGHVGGGHVGGAPMGGGHHDMHRPAPHMGHHPAPHMGHHPAPVHRPAPHPIPHHWAHCMRYMPDGRWAYLRDGLWYYYNCYYDPDYYFANPLHMFHNHCIETVAAAAVTSVAVANFVNMLMSY